MNLFHHVIMQEINLCLPLTCDERLTKLRQVVMCERSNHSVPLVSPIRSQSLVAPVISSAAGRICVPPVHFPFKSKYLLQTKYYSWRQRINRNSRFRATLSGATEPA